MRCFAWIPHETRGWEPCDGQAVTAVSDQHYCGYHSERIIAAVGGRWVYFAELNGEIKIGISDNPDRRIASFRSAKLLAVQPGTVQLERELHSLFSDHRITGEWFADCKEIRNYIASLEYRASGLEAASPSSRAEA